MSVSTHTSSCARCGKAVSRDSTRDGMGNAYCRACIDRLCGSDLPARGAMHTCALCGTAFQNGNDSARLAGKGHYCPDCLARLHGVRHERRCAAVTSFAMRDPAFDQMIEEIFDPGRAMARAG